MKASWDHLGTILAHLITILCSLSSFGLSSIGEFRPVHIKDNRKILDIQSKSFENEEVFSFGEWIEAAN